MRMYEVPAHGAMLLCDKAGLDRQEEIFSSGSEAVYYDDIHDAIERIEFYLSHDDERVGIAKAGYRRFWTNYEWAANLERLLSWAWALRDRREIRQ
jgi:spore maturation protein CgeB